MKNSLCILMVILMVVFSSGWITAATDTAKIDAMIQQAAGYWLDGRSGEDDKLGFSIIADAIIMATSETGFPAEFGVKISKAKDLFDSTSVFNPKGIALLKEAYLLINSGKEYQFPKSVSSMEQALEYTRINIEAARKNLKQGKIDECVKTVLEVAFLVVTPMYE